MAEKRPIPIAMPVFDQREAEAVRRPLESGWVTQGPEVAAFEREFAGYVGADDACAVSNCTTALHLALIALGVGPEDEVVTVSHSFIATANAIRYCGALPVFVDIDPLTYNMDVDALDQAITPRTKAVLCVHQMGMPCDVRRTVETARKRGIAVVEDAACAIGSEVEIDGRWERIGRPCGDIACFSFHPRKIITTGDGGMLTAREPGRLELFRRLRIHGMDLSPQARHQGSQVSFEGYAELGYNYRLTDIQAAIGRVQLERLPAIITRRRALAEGYRGLLARVPGVVPPREPAWARSNWQSYCVRLPEGCDQQTVMQRMLDAGVSTRRGIMCAHRERAYPEGTWRCAAPGCRAIAGECTHLAESERAQDHAIMLPLFHQLTGTEQETVVQALADAVRGS